MNKIKSLPIVEQPREKFISKGFESLSDAELLSLLVNAGTKQYNALELSKLLLKEHNYSLQILSSLSYLDIKKIPGIGQAKALSIAAAFELGRRKNSIQIPTGRKITSSEDAYLLLRSGMEDLKHEVFKVVLLNRNNIVIKIETISIGGVSRTVVDPKLVFKTALDHVASCIILAHNHPSGNLVPSSEDKRITKQLKEAGDLLSINVLDHLIISYKGYYSFADHQ